MRLIYLFSILLIANCGWSRSDGSSRSITGTSVPAPQPFICFLENKGQVTDQYRNTRKDIDFSITTPGVNVFVGKGALHYQWIRPAEDFARSISERFSQKQTQRTVPPRYDAFRLDVQLLHANEHALLVKELPLSYYDRYYLPQCPEGVQINAYQKMTYKNIYPNIDWVIYIKEEEIEYDFVVHPGGNVDDIQIRYNGADHLEIGEDGRLQIATPMGFVTESAPLSFQEDGRVVASRFVQNNNMIRFQVGQYKGTLTIDPKLKWGTYYGGGAGLFLGIFEDGAIDKWDNYYAVGSTNDVMNIATTGAHQTTLLGTQDALLVKFNSQGQRLWATYYGGPDADDGFSVTTDSSANVYFCGRTNSLSGMATPGAHQSTFGGGKAWGDAFLVKFDSAGVRQWGTYYGDTTTGNVYDDEGFCVRYRNGYLYLSGRTESARGIATPGAFMGARMGELTDAFLVQFDINGVRQWGTYFGGTGSENHGHVTTDKSGNVYLYGSTESPDNIASAGSFQTVIGGSEDLYLAKFNDRGQRLWSTYYGGPDTEEQPCRSSGFCDDDGNIYLTGITESATGIATNGSDRPQYSGLGDGLLVKFDSTGRREWATYVGGDETEVFTSVFVDKSSNIFLAGASKSNSGVATGNALQMNYSGTGMLNCGDVFLLQYDSLGKKVYGSYFGGTGDDAATHVVMDTKGDIYIGGLTNSISGISTAGSYQDTYPGSLLFNAFIAKFCFSTLPVIKSINGKDTICANVPETYTVAEDPDAEAYIWILSENWSGTSNSNSIAITSQGRSGRLTVKVVRCGDTSLAQHLDIYVLPVEPPLITVSGFDLSTTGTYQHYQWLFNGKPIAGATAATYRVTENGYYSVVTENAYGCVDTSAEYEVNNVSIEDLSGRDAFVTVYPNPARFEVHVQAAIPVSIIITGVDGRTVLRKEKAGRIDIRNLTSAIYLLQVYDQDGRLLKTTKLVKDTE